MSTEHDAAAPEAPRFLDRRRFVALCTRLGIGAAALPHLLAAAEKGKVTKEDLSAIEDLTGLHFSDPQRELMLKGLADLRDDFAKLRQVILHRPGLELSRLTPENIRRLLFDDILWGKRAREEHDAFAQALRDRGVKVHYFAELLTEVLDIPQARSWILDRTMTDDTVGPTLVGPVRRHPTIIRDYLTASGTAARS